MTEETKKPIDPVEIICAIIGSGQYNKDGSPMIGRATRKKAQAILDALQEAGWKVLR